MRGLMPLMGCAVRCGVDGRSSAAPEWLLQRRSARHAKLANQQRFLQSHCPPHRGGNPVRIRRLISPDAQRVHRVGVVRRQHLEELFRRVLGPRFLSTLMPSGDTRKRVACDDEPLRIVPADRFGKLHEGDAQLVVHQLIASSADGGCAQFGHDVRPVLRRVRQIGKEAVGVS